MALNDFEINHQFLMLALDHRESFLKLINPEHPDAVAKAEAIELKHQIMAAVIDQASGVLIDPDYGLPAYGSFDKPFLLPMEKTGYTDKAGERLTELEYSGEQLVSQGATGAKLLIYFHPDIPSAKSQLAVAKTALKLAEAANLPLFLEIRTYDPKQSGYRIDGDVVLRSVHAFLEAGIRPAVFKLEYPTNADYCQKITALLKDIPWILLTAGEGFDVFKGQLEVAHANGCVGFLAGRAVWQEVCQKVGPERREFLDTILPDRFRSIVNVMKL